MLSAGLAGRLLLRVLRGRTSGGRTGRNNAAGSRIPADMRHSRLTSFVLSEPRMILWTPGLLPGLVSNRVPDHGPVLWPTGYEADPRLPDLEVQTPVPANVALGHALQVAGSSRPVLFGPEIALPFWITPAA